MSNKKQSLDTLGELILERRGSCGVRSAAKEIGISSATLSRVENGHLPDLANFKLICNWLDVEPNQLLGYSPSDDNAKQTPTQASVHFKKKKTTSPPTAQSLGEMILRAQDALRAIE